MSNPSNTNTAAAAATPSTASAWARGPPSASVSPNPQQQQQQQQDGSAKKVNGKSSSPSVSGGSQSGTTRKSSLLAIGADGNEKTAAPNPSPAAPSAATAVGLGIAGGRAAHNAPGLNFGTLDSSAAQLSSSPAAQPTTGSHLDGSVKSFGSVPAADKKMTSPNPGASQPAAAEKVNGFVPSNAGGPAGRFDVHKLFGSSSSSAQQQQQQQQHHHQGPTPPPMSGGGHPMQAHGYDAQGRPLQGGQPGFAPYQPQAGLPPRQGQGQGGAPGGRPSVGGPGGARSPPVTQQQPNFGAGGPYRSIPGGVGGGGPQPGNVGMVRAGAGAGGGVGGPNGGQPGASPRMQHPHPGANPYGMPPQGPYANMGYGGGYYPAYPGFEGQFYAQPPPPPPGGGGQGMPLSPRNGQVPLPGTPVRTAASSSQPSAPGTPSMSTRSFTPGAPSFQPPSSSVSSVAGGAGGNLQVNASTFTPRPKATKIKISRDDGTEVDLASVAKKNAPAPPASPAPSSSAAGASGAANSSSATASSSPSPAPAKPANIAAVKPVIIRMETEAQREQRIKEQEEERRIKELEAKEQEERKARKEAAQKAEEEAKKRAAEQEEEERKAAEAKKIEEAKKAEEEEKSRKQEEEAKQEEEKKKADEAKQQQQQQQQQQVDDKKADETKSTSAVAGLPPKPAAAQGDGAAAPTTSASASPAVGGIAGLPPRPITPVMPGRKNSSLAVDDSSAPSSPQISSATAAALASAKPIEDLSSVKYPDSVKAPDAKLANAYVKFRYDREFLLQFMSIVKERPLNIPFEMYGIDRASGGEASMGRGGSARGSSRGGPRGGGGGGGNAGLGIGGMGNFGGKPGAPGMGSFGMGNFSRPAATSEERLAASRAAMGGQFAAARNAMARTPSQTGPMGMGNLRDAGSMRTRSARGSKRAPAAATAVLEPGVAPLELSANRWTPGVQAGRRPGAVDESSPEYIERKVKALLNKLTQEKFDSISDQILEWANRSKTETDGRTLRLVIQLIFEKAKDEQFWSAMYAQLCRKIQELLSPEVADQEMKASDGKVLSGGPLFRKYLLNRCQEDFEKGWKQKEDASAAAKTKAKDDEQRKAEHDAATAASGGQEKEEFKFSDEYYAEQAAKRQGLGLVKFVGELYKLEMLSVKVMNACILKLLSNVKDPAEEDVESLCQLLTTIGAMYERSSQHAQGAVSVYMTRMQDLLKSPALDSRHKFMVQGVIELQKEGWKQRGAQAQSGPMTIEEVHKQAAKEQAEAARAAAASLSGMSRGGLSSSRQGSTRTFSGASDAWATVGNRAPQKAADMSNFGQIKKGGPATFGPTSVFSKKPRSGDTTPPTISRTASSANMFSALEAETPEPSAAAAAPVEERKKLVLQPRSKDEGSEEMAAEEGGAKEETKVVDVDKKIKADLAEFWGIKDSIGTRNPKDVVEYFEALPADGRSKLAKALVDDVFRLAKQTDTDLVVEAFELAAEAGVLTKEDAKEGLTPSIELLDDLSLDVPNAFKFAAQLMLAVDLDAAEVEELAGKISIEYEPAVHPKDKLIKKVEEMRE